MSTTCTSVAIASIAFTLALSTGASAQFNERASLPGSGAADVDCSGRSVKNPRVRAIHSDDPLDVGSTAYFLATLSGRICFFHCIAANRFVHRGH